MEAEVTIELMSPSGRRPIYVQPGSVLRVLDANTRAPVPGMIATLRDGRIVVEQAAVAPAS